MDVYAQRKNTDLGRTFRRKAPQGASVYDEANKVWPKSPSTSSPSLPKATGKTTHPPGGIKNSPQPKPQLQTQSKAKPKAQAKPKLRAQPKVSKTKTQAKPKTQVKSKSKKTSSGYALLKKTVARRAIEK
jgi:hypothetical protein